MTLDYGRKEIEILHWGKKKGMWNYMFVSLVSIFHSHPSPLEENTLLVYKNIFRPFSIFQIFISVEDFEYSGFCFSFAISCFSCLLCVSKMVSLKSSQNDCNSFTFILLFVSQAVFSHICICPFWRLQLWCTLAFLGLQSC